MRKRSSAVVAATLNVSVQVRANDLVDRCLLDTGRLNLACAADLLPGCRPG